ncbi:hypothetical protein [Streptomyces sp. NPDC050560]|uniref:hypothetical protein n=1 Tax=Streptomyces sp. NPDC050560 TaxID=3365630 RepID=UPI0037B24902
MFSYQMHQLRQAELIRAAEHHRLVREAREARRARRRGGPQAPERRGGPRHDSYAKAA